ncbi:MAG: DUF2283 domain-containing protein [bacterium]|nr:DUF2283 domain-containing protein [bacterium]
MGSNQNNAGRAVKLRVDRQADALHLRLDDSAIVESVEVVPGVVLDFNEAEEVVAWSCSDSRRARRNSTSRLCSSRLYRWPPIPSPATPSGVSRHPGP